MALSGYRYAGDHLAQAQAAWDVQHQNMGVLELNIDRVVPGGKELLILALQEFTVPGRSVGKGTLEYLNGNTQYAQRPDALDNISVTFRDFPLQNARGILNEWFKLVYDEETGLMLPMGLVKTTGFLVLFGSNGLAERRARLEGLWPMKQPETAISFSTGEVMSMQIDLSVDRVIWSSLSNPQSGNAA